MEAHHGHKLPRQTLSDMTRVYPSAQSPIMYNAPSWRQHTNRDEGSSVSYPGITYGYPIYENNGLASTRIDAMPSHCVQQHESRMSSALRYETSLSHHPPQRAGWRSSPPPALLPHQLRSTSAMHLPYQHTAFADSAVPTYTGHIKTSTDAILLLSACDLPDDPSLLSPASKASAARPSPPPRRIQRRLLESERASLIRSGSVFAWEESEAGMRRWTDGRCWSASRVSGCFLTYRELEVRKRSTSDPNGPKANQYKVDGLIKQSFSITSASGRKLHVVSYYTKRDIRENRLRRVSEDPRFVGEAGGEWGLSVDEHELPDPDYENIALPRAEHEHAVQSSVGGESPRDTLAKDATVSRPISPASSIASAGDTRFAASSRGFARAHLPAVCWDRDAHSGYPTHVTMSSKRSSHDMVSPHYPPRPFKRARSTTPERRAPPIRAMPTLSQLDGSAPRRQSDDALSRSCNKMLTVSNIRGTGVQPTAFQSPLTPSLYDSDTPSGSEQDGAAGALLSLRGANDSHMLKRLDESQSGSSRQSNSTPLTTPEGSNGTNTPKDLYSESKRLSLQRPPAPDRMPSDADALSKLGVRL